MPAPKLLTHNGQTHSMSEWGRRLGMKISTLSQRIRNERNAESALTDPLGMTKRGTQFGEGCVRPDGYRILSINGQPLLEHIHIAQRALGRELKGEEEVHHFNEERADNRNENLIICPNRAYHLLLHLRQKALSACGNAAYRLCKFCGCYDDPASMYDGTRSFYHRRCSNKHKREYRNSRKEKLCQSQT